MLKIKKRTKNDYLIIEMRDDLDENRASGLNQMLEDELESGRVKIVLDFSGIEQICSLSLGIIIKSVNKFKEKSGDIVILNPKNKIETLIGQTKLDTVIRIIYDENEL